MKAFQQYFLKYSGILVPKNIIYGNLQWWPHMCALQTILSLSHFVGLKLVLYD